MKTSVRLKYFVPDCSNIVTKKSFLKFRFLEGTLRPEHMAIVEARHSCRIVITTSFFLNFYNWDMKFP